MGKKRSNSESPLSANKCKKLVNDFLGIQKSSDNGQWLELGEMLDFLFYWFIPSIYKDYEGDSMFLGALLAGNEIKIKEDLCENLVLPENFFEIAKVKPQQVWSKLELFLNSFNSYQGFSSDDNYMASVQNKSDVYSQLQLVPYAEKAFAQLFWSLSLIKNYENFVSGYNFMLSKKDSEFISYLSHHFGFKNDSKFLKILEKYGVSLIDAREEGPFKQQTRNKFLSEKLNIYIADKEGVLKRKIPNLSQEGYRKVSDGDKTNTHLIFILDPQTNHADLIENMDFIKDFRSDNTIKDKDDFKSLYVKKENFEGSNFSRISDPLWVLIFVLRNTYHHGCDAETGVEEIKSFLNIDLLESTTRASIFGELRKIFPGQDVLKYSSSRGTLYLNKYFSMALFVNAKRGHASS